jgi:pimeloyl-ACP methyl ester carboxylesterase
MSDPPPLSDVTHEYVDAGGLRTHVALAGPPNAPPILLVHGWPQNWWAWRRVIPALSTGHRVIVPDLRGHGWTEAPRLGYGKAQLAADLIAVLDALEIERTTWVGHDWGAWAGFLAALRAPERIERMLALCIPHPWVPPHPGQLALLGYQGPISLPVLGPRVADRMIRLILQSGRGDERLSDTDVAIFAENIPPQVTVAMYRTFLTRELLPIARGRYAAVLLGARDLVTRTTPSGPVDGQPRLHVEVLREIAHWVPEQRPGSIIDWVDPTLSRD